MFTLLGLGVKAVVYCVVGLMILLFKNFVCGCIAKRIAIKRGMKGEGFFWGFFLGVLGIAVMRICPKY